MKKISKPLSMTRLVKTGMQVYRQVELKGICFSVKPKWSSTELGGPYRESK